LGTFFFILQYFKIVKPTSPDIKPGSGGRKLDN
jgi:hypothetical protein